MFVKIQYWEVKRNTDEVIVTNRLDVEHIYDVNHISLFTESVKEVKTPEVHLTLEFNKDGPDGWDRTISFPEKQENQVVEIYVMNNHGKTIERYVY